MHLANLLSLALFIGFALHFQFVELARTKVPQLDTANVSYCELGECDEIFGITIDNGATAQQTSEQTPIGVELTLQITNQARYEGRRQLWLRMETKDGAFVEATSTWVDFELKNRTTAIFLITGTRSEIESNRILIGY